MSDGEGFVSRWARRKAQLQGGAAAVQSGQPVPLPQRETLPGGQAGEPACVSPPAQRVIGGEGPVAPTTPRDAPRPPPTMDDVAKLTRSSDYSRFIAPGVDDSVKRAAMKKLFSDPHFNVMDGLDVYIEDYGVTIPLTEDDLRKMAQSQFLRLFEKDEPQSPEALANTDGAPPAQLSQSQVGGPVEPAPSAVPPDENADLRLQPDDAAGRAGAEPGPRPAER